MAAGCGVSEVTEDRAPDRTIRERSREPKLHEMMDCRIWKQRREQMLGEVERNRRAKALRATHKRRDGRRSALIWEMKRHAGRLLKFLRALRNAGKSSSQKQRREQIEPQRVAKDDEAWPKQATGSSPG